MHPLASPFVSDQLSLRIIPANEVRLQPDGDYILYWMQSTQRLEENWALRFATLEADRLNRPLLVYHGLDPSYEHASDRIHTFVLEGAREIARRAEESGYCYRFTLRRRRSDDRRTVDRLARRACLVITDFYPTAGVNARTARFAQRAPCRVVMVDSVGIVPTSTFFREEYAARTIRPKLQRLLELSLEPVEDRPPRRAMPDAIVRSLDIQPLDLPRIDIAREVAKCEIDHEVGTVSTQGGLAAARERLAAFVTDALPDYASRRKDPGDEEGSSRLSPYLHFGQIAAAEVARSASAATSSEVAQTFLDEMITWRELALNFCVRNPHFSSIQALPEWARRSMDKHASDPREVVYSLEELEAGSTHDDLWNAGQRELVATGYMHNAVRMLWGKSVLLWTRRYEDALETLLHLNNKYALDGRDPNSYANIQWCFGKFDRPFAARPVWGTIRPMSLTRARAKFDAARYVKRWNGQRAGLSQLELDMEAVGAD